jgi:hypothetical protein
VLYQGIAFRKAASVVKALVMQIAMGIRACRFKGSHITCGALREVQCHCWNYTDGYDAKV